MLQCHYIYIHIYIIILIGKRVTQGANRQYQEGWEGGRFIGAWGARHTLVLRSLQEMFRCFVQGRRVLLKSIMSHYQGDYYENQTVQTTIFNRKQTGNIYLLTYIINGEWSKDAI